MEKVWKGVYQSWHTHRYSGTPCTWAYSFFPPPSLISSFPILLPFTVPFLILHLTHLHHLLSASSCRMASSALALLLDIWVHQSKHLPSRCQHPCSWHSQVNWVFSLWKSTCKVWELYAWLFTASRSSVAIRSKISSCWTAARRSSFSFSLHQ